MFGMFKKAKGGSKGGDDSSKEDARNQMRAEMAALQEMANRDPSQSEQDDIYSRVVADVRSQAATPPPASTMGTPGQRAPQVDQDDMIRRAMDSFRQDPPPSSYQYQSTPMGANPFQTRPPMRSRRGY